MKQMILSGVSVVASESIKQLVNVFIKPKLESMYKNSEKENKIDFIQDNIIEYFIRSYENNSFMSTLVFINQKKCINDLYIPLTISKICKENNEQIKINSGVNEFISGCKKILLVDNAGMGKSTIVKFLHLKAIEENKGIPILIELRKLNKNMSIIDYIIKEMNSIKDEFNKEDILDLISQGDFIFFLDGYDEIVSENKSILTNNIQSFINKAYTNRFIITSREQKELKSFKEFERFYINPLNEKEAYSLIRKYDNNGELSKELINRLKTEENLKNLKEFLENPLMVSLLYKAFDYKKTIPDKKYMFYRQVYDALFEDHDLSKSGAYKRNLKSNLNIEDFHKILRYLAYITINRGIIYCKEKLIEFIELAKEKNKHIQFNANDFLNDIVYAVPIFIKEGIEYRWAHKSFQEYFLSCCIFIDIEEKYKVLEIMSHKKNINNYYNILDLYYDIDYKQFEKAIIYPLIKDYCKFCDEKYTDNYFNNFNKETILLRKYIECIHEKTYVSWDVNFIKQVNDFIDNEEIEIDYRIRHIQELRFFRGKQTIIIATSSENSSLLTLLTLLYNKKSSLVKEYSFQSQYDFEEKKEYFNKIFNEYLFEVDDRCDNPLNKLEIFEFITYFILEKYLKTQNSRPFIILDYERCRILKDIIDKKSEEEDLLKFL